MKDRDTFLSFHELKERYDVQTNFLTFHSLLIRNANFESFLSKSLKFHKANQGDSVQKAFFF